MELTTERLQEIKNRGYRRRAISPNDWGTILKDVKELIAAYETSQRELAELLRLDKGDIHIEKINKLITTLTTKLEASQAEVERLRKDVEYWKHQPMVWEDNK